RYVYSVIFDGKLIVDRSRDPECDAARALSAMGYTGKLTMLDGKTGKPRTIIDVEKAAGLTVEETGNFPRFRKWRERGGSGLQRRNWQRGSLMTNSKIPKLT